MTAGGTTQLLADTRTAAAAVPAAAPTAAASPNVPAPQRAEGNTTTLLADATALSSFSDSFKALAGPGKGSLLEENTLDDFALPPEPPALMPQGKQLTRWRRHASFVTRVARHDHHQHAQAQAVIDE